MLKAGNNQAIVECLDALQTDRVPAFGVLRRYGGAVVNTEVDFSVHCLGVAGAQSRVPRGVVCKALCVVIVALCKGVSLEFSAWGEGRWRLLTSINSKELKKLLASYLVFR